MSNENIQLKIDLLQEQIDNLEKSGFFTEKEINSRSIPLKAHLAIFKKIKWLNDLSESTRLTIDCMLVLARSFDQLGPLPNVNYGLSKESYEEGKKIHDELFSPFHALKIKVVDAEILTPNHQEANL